MLWILVSTGVYAAIVMLVLRYFLGRKEAVFTVQESVPENVGMEIVPAIEIPQPPIFPEGRWVRHQRIGLMMIGAKKTWSQEDSCWYLSRRSEGGIDGPPVWLENCMEIARPKHREWWTKVHCPKHMDPHGYYQSMKPVQWRDSPSLSSLEEEWVQCGCLVPVNSGVRDDRKKEEELPPAKFKKDGWVRHAVRGLGMVVAEPEWKRCHVRWANRWFYSVKFGDCIGTLGGALEDDLGEALPRAGEWWEGKPCSDHGATSSKPYQWPSNAMPGSWNASRARCGCLVPSNFGRSPEEAKPDRAYKDGQWLRYRIPWALKSDEPKSALACVTSAQLDPAGKAWLYNLDAGGIRFFNASEDDLRPAVPEAGEWWQDKECPDHHGRMNEGRPFVAGPATSGPLSQVWIRCGCRFPVNFGKGEGLSEPAKKAVETRASFKSHPSVEFKYGDWVRVHSIFLGQVESLITEHGLYYAIKFLDGSTAVVPQSKVEKAVPMNGERWKRPVGKCDHASFNSDHCVVIGDVDYVSGLFLELIWHNQAEIWNRVKCGCLVPVEGVKPATSDLCDLARKE